MRLRRQESRQMPKRNLTNLVMDDALRFWERRAEA
jgi:hypothetical protein